MEKEINRLANFREKSEEAQKNSAELAREAEKAKGLLTWIESVADSHGDLPEQVNEHTLAPKMFPVWKERWGPVASPLLWSHAMYLILVQALKE